MFITISHASTLTASHSGYHRNPKNKMFHRNGNKTTSFCVMHMWMISFITMIYLCMSVSMYM